MLSLEMVNLLLSLLLLHVIDNITESDALYHLLVLLLFGERLVWLTGLGLSLLLRRLFIWNDGIKAL